MLDFFLRVVPEFTEHVRSVPPGEGLLKTTGFIVALLGLGFVVHVLWQIAFTDVESLRARIVWRTGVALLLATLSFASVVACVGIANRPDLYLRRDTAITGVVLLFTLASVLQLLVSAWMSFKALARSITRTRDQHCLEPP